MATFETFNLLQELAQAIEEAGYKQPTPIQMEAIPKIFEGTDLRATAQTGSGKSAAFLLPIIHRIASTPGPKAPRALIVVPTRELAMQLQTQVEKYTKYLRKIRSVCVYGGVPIFKQLRQVMKPHDILIATPGRLIDFIKRKKSKLAHIEMLVLDEADRMLDMGFVEPVREIVAAIPPNRQTLLFTATLQQGVKKLSEELLNQPFDIAVKQNEAGHQNIKQILHYVDDIHYKNRLLNHILRQEGIDTTIVFTATKRQAGLLVEELEEKGHQIAALHGDMNQRQRTRTLAMLRQGKIKTLIATDVAARGIDVSSISHVINYDLPQCTEDYVHRIGRTGRAGAHGTALSFVARRDLTMLKKIEKYTGKAIDVVDVEGFQPPRMNKDAFHGEKRSKSRGPRRGGGGFFCRTRRKRAQPAGARRSR